MDRLRALWSVSILLGLVVSGLLIGAVTTIPLLFDIARRLTAYQFIVTATFVLAGVVKGVTGLGLPTVSMAILGSFMPPTAAASLLLVPSFVTNVWQLFAGPAFIVLARRLWPLLVGIAVGTPVSAGLIDGSGTGWETAGLGCALVVYAGMALGNVRAIVPPGRERSLSLVAGLITGLVTGATGVFVIPAVPYLQSLGLAKDDLVQALGLSFTVSTIALAGGLAGSGTLQSERLGASAIAILPALVGMGLGQVVRARVSPPVFRFWFLICLAMLGAHLMLRAVL